MNNVSLIGRLTKDPELRFAAGNGTAVCKFTLAVQRPFKKDETDFLNCVAFGKTGETISQYLTKGKQLGVNGYIQTGSYDAQDGTKRYTTDIIVNQFTFISSGNRDNNGGGYNSNSDYSAQNNDRFAGAGFDDDIIPVDDGDMPF